MLSNKELGLKQTFHLQQKVGLVNFPRQSIIQAIGIRRY